MIEIYSDRITLSNPGQPLISIERFIDEYQSRNDSLADIMRRMGICEEKGSGMDKTIFYIELYQLPPVRLQLQETRTETTVFSYRKFADLDKTERVMACYQHACLRYVSNEKMNNQSLRGRLGIEDKTILWHQGSLRIPWRLNSSKRNIPRVTVGIIIFPIGLKYN